MKLNELSKGDTGVVLRVVDEDQVGRRMREMGIIHGTSIQVVGEAPLRDPMIIKVFDTVLAVRRSEASFVILESAGE